MRPSRAGLVALLILHFLPFVGRPALIGGDEPHYALMAHSIAVDRDLEIEADYAAVAAGSLAAGRKFAGTTLEPHLLEYDGRRIFSHPLGLPLLVAPLLWLQQQLLPGSAPDITLGLFGLTLTLLALLEGLRLLEKANGDPRLGRAVGLAVYFTTPLWFYSRTFFTEPYIWSFLVLAIGLIDRRRPLWASLLLGWTFLLKESTAVLIASLLLWAWRRAGWGLAARLAAFPMVALLLFGVKNRWVYGRWLVTFQPFELGSPVEGLLGLLFDPRHGLLPFAPLAVIAVLGWTAAVRQQDEPLTARYGLMAFVGLFLLTALWVDWRGGSGYGPRLLVPVLPTLTLPLLFVAARLPRRPMLARASAALAVLGFALQWSAVSNPFRAFWSISVFELFVDRPLSFASGLALGGLAVWWLSRPIVGAISGHGDAAGPTLR